MEEKKQLHVRITVSICDNEYSWQDEASEGTAESYLKSNVSGVAFYTLEQFCVDNVIKAATRMLDFAVPSAYEEFIAKHKEKEVKASHEKANTQDEEGEGHEEHNEIHGGD